jgi:hypothetical protein
VTELGSVTDWRTGPARHSRTRARRAGCRAGSVTNRRARVAAPPGPLRLWRARRSGRPGPGWSRPGMMEARPGMNVCDGPGVQAFVTPPSWRPAATAQDISQDRSSSYATGVRRSRVPLVIRTRNSPNNMTVNSDDLSCNMLICARSWNK